MSAGIARGLDPDVLLTPEEVAARTEAAREFIEFFGALIARRRAQPQDDLISALAAVEAAGDRLTAHEMLATLVVLVVAGHETTVNLVGNGVLALLRNPGQFALLRDNPDLAAPAVDELLRYDAPSQLTTRVATREIELSGHTFVPGDGVMVMFGSANRDPHAFDEPDRLDLTRYTDRNGVNRHMSFGLGLHYCIGAPLVRLEMEIALRALAGRAPTVELLADPPAYRPNLVVRGMAELPVRFTG
ncbi:cytochrome P450 [Candidatus Protofrankia californiensis]|uniref:Cytochrome P450 n=2 Tax=Protofrankia TaxID=2994361 RepID=A0A1C3P3B1_9ACTN|nr:cytochrome P450 [Candidatus Protofrankia californiensis]